MVEKPPTVWYRRHAIGLVLVCLLAVSLILYFRPVEYDGWFREKGVLLNRDNMLLSDVTFNAATSTYTTQQKPGYITWKGDVLNGADFIRISISPDVLYSESAFILQYSTDDMPYFDDDLIHTRSLRPRISSTGSALILSFTPIYAAKDVRLQLAPQLAIQLVDMHANGYKPNQQNWHYWRLAIEYCLYALTITTAIVWLTNFLPIIQPWLLSPMILSILWLLCQGLVMVFWLPPFQGPDENRHWKTAVELFRSDGQASSILQLLPAYLNAEVPRLRSEIRFSKERFQATEPVPAQEAIKVTYTRHWGYPTVGLVSLLFPRVTTLNEALYFYYACRLLNLLCLLVLVSWAWKLGLGSCTLMVFLSFPLVMQQCVIVSTDTAHNLGTFLALLLWVKHYRDRRTWSLIALIVVSLLVVAAKPPIYLGVLLLPAWFLPWSKLLKPLPILLMLVCIAVSLGVGMSYLWRIVDDSRMHMGDEARTQLKYILTAEGIEQFIGAAMEYPHRVLNPAYWFEPLGWLDTLLSPQHLLLIWISLGIAASVDVFHFIRRTRSLGCWSLMDLLEPLVGSISSAFFIWWSLALVMYLTITPYQSTGIVGMQVRYMVPAVLCFLLWPLGRWQVPTNLPKTNYYGIGCLLLLLLGLFRTSLLMFDLYSRYWQ